MPAPTIRGVLITTDAALRETINSASRSSTDGLAVVLDFDVALNEFTGAQFKAVQQAGPVLVFLDLETAPDLGISLARDLTQAAEQVVVVAIGRELSSDLLIQALRAGVAEYLAKPVSASGLAEALQRLRPRLAASPEADVGAGRAYAFFSAKGGSGSSTAITNLAIELHRTTGRKTLIVDLDAELGEISLLLGVQPQFNFVDLVQNFHRMDANLLASYIEQHSSGVHLLSAPFHPERAADITEDEIRQILIYLKGMYDYILVDTPKSFSPETLAAFEQASGVFLVATVDLPSLRNIQRALPLLRKVMPRGSEQLHLVINRYDPNDEISVKDVEKTLGIPVYATLANDYDAVIRSVNSSRPVVMNGSKSPYARDIRALAARIGGEPAAEVPERESLLGRFTHKFRTAKPAAERGGAKRD